MRGFKEQIQQDINIFLSLDEFAEMHDIDGHRVPAVVESDILKIRSERITELYDGIHKGEIAVFVRSTGLPYRPVFGEHIKLDGELYLVVECNEDMGVLKIILGANEA